MSINIEEITHIATLAKIGISTTEAEQLSQNLNNILRMVQEMESVNTDAISPLSHPLELRQRLREDRVTEGNRLNVLQNLAPQAEAGLYLVPLVIE